MINNAQNTLELSCVILEFNGENITFNMDIKNLVIGSLYKA